MPDPTPGQLAYETWYLALENTLPAGSTRWSALEARHRDAWEGAAQAVMTAWMASPDWPTPPQEEPHAS